VKGFADALKQWRIDRVIGDDYGGGSRSKASNINLAL
jgi:hypothetical protein